MADGPRPPGAFITITCKHPGPPFEDRHRAFQHDLDGARAWVGQPQHEVTFAGTAEEANAGALEFYFQHLRDIEGTRRPPPPRYASVHHFADVEGRPCFAITYVIAGERPAEPVLPIATAQVGQRRLACVGETLEQAEAMRRAAESQAHAGHALRSCLWHREPGAACRWCDTCGAHVEATPPAEPDPEQREQLRAMGHDVDAPDFGERMRTAAEVLLRNLSEEEFEGLIAQDLFRRTDPGTSWAMLTPAGLAEGLRRAGAVVRQHPIVGPVECPAGEDAYQSWMRVWNGLTEEQRQTWSHLQRQYLSGQRLVSVPPPPPEVPRERVGTMSIRGESYPLYRGDTAADIAQRIGGSVDERGAVVPPPPPPPPRVTRTIFLKGAKLYLGGKEIATLPEVKFTPAPPRCARVYDTRDPTTISLTATWSSADPADRQVQLERPRRAPRRLGWREKRRAAGAKRRGRP